LAAQLLREGKEPVSPKKHAARLLHRKFLERLLTLSEGRTTLYHRPLRSAPDFIEINTDISGLDFRYVVGQDKRRVELYIHRPDTVVNKRIFDELTSHKHKIEGDFGGQLSWERLDERKSSRIAYRMWNGGSKDNEGHWQTIQIEMIDAMVSFEKALRPFISKLHM
jgi:hypothetical protein